MGHNDNSTIREPEPIEVAMSMILDGADPAMVSTYLLMASMVEARVDLWLSDADA